MFSQHNLAQKWLRQLLPGEPWQAKDTCGEFGPLKKKKKTPPEEPFSFYPIITSTLLAFLASTAHLHHVGNFIQEIQQYWQSTPSWNSYLIWRLENYSKEIENYSKINLAFLGPVLFGERLGDLHVAPEYHSKITPKPKFYFQEPCTPDSTGTKTPFKVSSTLYAFNLVDLLQNQKCLSLAVSSTA